MEEYLEEIQRLAGGLDIQVNVKPWPNSDIWVAAQEKNWGDGMYQLEVAIDNRWQIVATWQLWQMKNCCAIQVSTKAEVFTAFRERGIGSLCNKIRIESARRNGYARLMCTAVTSGMENMPQTKILLNNGWRRIDSFVNPRTDNTVGVFVYNL
jgi:hypothetical protein